jgi:hypothetical protein
MNCKSEFKIHLRCQKLAPVSKTKLITLFSLSCKEVGATPTKKKSWTKKLADSKDLPKVEKITDKMSKRWGTGKVVIPAPMEVDEMLRKVPEGKLATINEIREALAKKHGATIGCPIQLVFLLGLRLMLLKNKDKRVKKILPLTGAP